MNIRQKALIGIASLLLAWSGWKGLNALMISAPLPGLQTGKGEATMSPKVRKTDAEWKQSLTPEQYKVMIQCGTEAPFSGRYNDFWEKGSYLCAACGAALFTSETKYEHGTGWPSFTAPFSEANVEYREDASLGCSGPRSAARPAAPTWATSSMTAPPPPAGTIASTPRP